MDDCAWVLVGVGGCGCGCLSVRVGWYCFRDWWQVNLVHGYAWLLVAVG